MAPKLPPPANTKAVFAGLAWLGTDNPRSLPISMRRQSATRRSAASIAARQRTARSTMFVAWAGYSCRRRRRVRVPALRRNTERAVHRVRDTKGSAFDERLFDHEMTGFAVAAFEKAARFKSLAQLLEHARAAAHHDPVGFDIQRRQTDVVKQLLRRDQVGNAAAVAERFAGDGRIIQQLLGQ